MTTELLSNTKVTMALKRVVVGIDDSDLSREAFAYGAMIAKAANVELHAMHVWESVAGDGQEMSWEPSEIRKHLARLGIPSASEDCHELVSAYKIIEECRTYCQNCSVTFTTSLMLGPLTHRLVEFGRDELLVIGKGRFGHAGFGSTARQMLQHAVSPVLVVAGPLRAISRVLTIFDGTPEGLMAMDFARELAEQTHWPLTVLAVSSPDALSYVLQTAQDHAPDSQVMVFGPVDGSKAAQIEHAAEKVRSGLVVAPVHSDSWFHQLFLGGTTDHVLSHLDAPIVLIH